MGKKTLNFKDFNKYDFQDWQSKVADDLVRVGKSSKKLTKMTLDGITPKPLYCAETTTINDQQKNPPGFYPFVRGFKAVNEKNIKMQQRFNALYKNDLKHSIEKSAAHGVEKIILNYDESSNYFLGAIDKEDLEIFDSIEKDISLEFDFGEYYFPLLAKIEAFDFKNRTNLSLRVDPIGHFLEYGKSMFSMDEHVYFVQQILHCHHALKIEKLFNFSSQVVLNAGANNVQELAYLLSNAMFWIKRLGVEDLNKLLPYINFTIGVDSEMFHSIAKIRAFRLIWSRMCNILGMEEFANQITISARFNENWISSLDPWVNMLRNTSACFAAMLANVDCYLPFAHDEKRRYQFSEDEKLKSWSDRIAQNTVHLLNRESHLSHVIDPAGGSYVIESLTNELAQKAWSLFQEISNEEDFFKYLKGNHFHKMIEKNKLQNFDLIKKRKVSIAGVNQYSNLADNLIGDAPSLPSVTPYLSDTQSATYVDLVKKVRDKKFVLGDLIKILKQDAKIGHIINIFKAHAESESITALERTSIINLFEDLRKKVQILKSSGVSVPSCHLLITGNAAKLSARISFCRDYFEVIELKVNEIFIDENFSLEQIQVDDIICFVASDEEYVDLFEISNIQSLENKFKYIAGNLPLIVDKYKNMNLQYIYHGQDVYDVLEKIVQAFESKTSRGEL